MKKTKFRRLAAMAASLLCCLIFTVPAYAQSSEPQPETAPAPAETEAAGSRDDAPESAQAEPLDDEPAAPKDESGGE